MVVRMVERGEVGTYKDSGPKMELSMVGESKLIRQEGDLAQCSVSDIGEAVGGQVPNSGLSGSEHTQSDSDVEIETNPTNISTRTPVNNNSPYLVHSSGGESSEEEESNSFQQTRRRRRRTRGSGSGRSMRSNASQNKFNVLLSRKYVCVFCNKHAL